MFDQPRTCPNNLSVVEAALKNCYEQINRLPIDSKILYLRDPTLDMKNSEITICTHSTKRLIRLALKCHCFMLCAFNAYPVRVWGAASDAASFRDALHSR